MPYVGRDLQRGNYLKLDDISSSFDGSTTTFNLTSGGNAFFPGSAFSIIVSLGGVIQEPESAFQIDRSQIIFATAPSPNDDFFCIVQGVALGVGVPGHNTVNNDQLAKPLSYGDYFRWDSANNRVGINTLLPSTALDVVGSATFSGNVSIGGTLTYEDVANIDAVGLITARAGIEDKTLTTGHVVFAGTNGRLSGDSNLFYNNSTDSLGISTNNPGTTLEVVGTGMTVFNEAKNAGVDIHGAGKIELVRSDGVAYIDFKTSFSEDFDCRIQQADNGLRFYTGGQGSTDERLRISSDGNIGINEDGPAYKLVINEEDVATGTAHTMLSALNPVVYIDVGNEIDHNIVLKKHETDAQDEVGGLLFASSPDATNYNWAGIKAIEDANATVTDIAFFTAPNNSSGANSIERVRLHNGNIGIGTTDPTALLHIFQNNSTIGHDLRIEQKGSGDSVLGFSITGTRAYSMGIDNDDSDKFKFATGSDLTTNTFVTITSDGKIGIGQPTPATTLEIKSNANAQTTATIPTLRITNDDGSAVADDITGSVEFHTEDSSDPNHISGFMRNISETNAGVNYALIFGTKDNTVAGDATEKLRITSVGEVKIANGGFLTINTDVSGNYALQEAIRIDDGGGTGDRALQFFEYHHTGMRSHRIQFNTNTTTNGSAYTHTQGAYGGSSAIEFEANGELRFYTNASDSSGSTSTITPSERLRITSAGTINLISNKVLVGSGCTDGSAFNVKGSAGFADDGTNAGIIISTDDANGAALSCLTTGGFANGSYGIMRFNAVQHKFTYGNTQRLLIDANGLATFSGEVATAQDYPNFRPTLDFNFAAERKLDPRITYSRTGPASFTDEFGKVVLIGDNTPRFDHDPLTRECKGYLVEESRTNYVRVSTNLESEWAAGSGSFAVDNTITNPDGSVGAYYHTGAELYHQNIDLSGASTDTITVSLWVKERSGQSGNLDIQIYQQITGSVVDLGGFSFNPATGAISLTSNYSNGRVEEYPNGWYRVSAKLTTASGNFSSSTRYDMQNAEHYVWGMQMEVGAFPTSFIPTYGSTATRGLDITTIEDQEFTEFYSSDEWTMITHSNIDNSKSLVASPSAVNSINFQGDNNTKKFQTRYVTSSTDNQGYVDVIGAMSGTNYFDLVGGGTGNYNVKTALAAKVNDVAASFNGGTVQTDTSVTMLEGGSIMNIGENPKQLHIKRIMYYPKRLPNSQLVTLTS